MDDGGVKCWGLQHRASMHSVERARSRPETVVGLTNVVKVVGGGDRSCALTQDGEVVCWESNDFGNPHREEGEGQALATVPGLERGVVSLTSGFSHFCAVTGEGRVVCWGRGSEGQLGNGDDFTSIDPVPVANLEGVADMALGGEHTCAIDGDGSAWCWGEGQWGRLGDGHSDSSDLPVRFGNPGMKAVSIAAGAEHTCMLAEKGQVLCVGSNGYSQLGDGTEAGHRRVPVYVVAE